MPPGSKSDTSLGAAPKLGWRFKVLYGIGEITNAVKLVTFGLYSLFFATVVLRLPGTWIGIVGFLAMLWDAAIDPYIGYLTDGAGAVGRRFRFMMTGTLIMGFGYWAFFSPPLHLSTGATFAWLLVASLAVRTATSMFTIPYYALGASLTADYQERTSITAVRGAAGIVGTLLTASLSFVVFFPDKVRGVDPKTQPSGYASMGLAFGVLMTVVALTALLGSLPLRKVLEARGVASGEAPVAFFRSVAAIVGNPSYRVILLSFTLVVVALTINSSMLLHFLKYYAGIASSAALSSSQGALYTASIFGMFFWLRMSGRVEKHHLFVLACGATAFFLVATLVLFGEGRPFGAGSAIPLVVGYAVAGFVTCIFWFVPQSMMADVVDEDDWRTGQRREGSLFGVVSFCQQVATGVAVMVAGGLLEHVVRLNPALSRQAPATVAWLGIVYGVVPAFLFLAAAAIMLRYGLTRSRVATIQAALVERQSCRATEPSGLADKVRSGPADEVIDVRNG
ncbi:MAG: MFS transporter [Candidatus Solibacter sp.]